jgi:hypothetical protein
MLAGSGLLLVGGLIRRRRPRATTAGRGGGSAAGPAEGWKLFVAASSAARNGRLAAPARSRRLAGTD